jgi:hypothetical protein
LRSNDETSEPARIEFSQDRERLVRIFNAIRHAISLPADEYISIRDEEEAVEAEEGALADPASPYQESEGELREALSLLSRGPVAGAMDPVINGTIDTMLRMAIAAQRIHDT